MLGPIDHSGLRRALGIDRTSVSVIVPVLQARGLITSGRDVEVVMCSIDVGGFSAVGLQDWTC
jgi:hypothetical protein